MKPQSLRDRFVLMEQRVELFWSVWTKDYLRNLPTTVVTAKQRCNLKVGSVVLVQDDNCPRLKWPLGIVIRMYPGQDGVVRKVLVRTSKGEIERSIQRLHDLEISSSSIDTGTGNNTNAIAKTVNEDATDSDLQTVRRSNRRIVLPKTFDNFQMYWPELLAVR